MTNKPKRRHARNWPPKGSYPHPDGGYILPGHQRPDSRIQVTGHLKSEPDLKKLAEALVQTAAHINKEKPRDKNRP